MRVAQVTARLGETILDLAHVVPGERYTIGSAPGVRLVLAGMTAFPLVSSEARGFVVRRPVGLGTLGVDGKPSAVEELVLGWERVVFALGLVAIEISLVERAAMPVPKPAIDWRMPAFLVASLIAHLVVWGVAVTVGHAPPVKRRPVEQAHPLLAHLAPLPPPPLPPPPPPSASPPKSSAPRATASAPHAAPRGDHPAAAHDGPADMGEAMAQLAAAMPNVAQALDEAGPLYVPGAVEQPFGDTPKLDPNTRPGWGALKIVTGRYRTIGVDDPIPASQGLALCESRRCEVSGGLAKEDVQQAAATRGYDLERCVNRGAVVLDLDIAADGRVTKVHGEGKGARCAAQVIASLAFPAAGDPTHATFTIGYP